MKFEAKPESERDELWKKMAKPSEMGRMREQKKK